MSYQFRIGKNNEIPLPDKIFDDLEIKIGDILIFEIIDNTRSFSLKKHCNQALSDDDIASSENLARVVPYAPEAEISSN